MPPRAAVMSISERERHALDSIANGLARSAPELASKLSLFSRLTADEEMPVREQGGRAARAPGPRRIWRRPVGRRPLGRETLRWLWLVAVAAALALTVTFTHSSVRSTCRAWPTTTCGQAPAHPGAVRPGGQGPPG
jgi:hypothetical protein